MKQAVVYPGNMILPFFILKDRNQIRLNLKNYVDLPINVKSILLPFNI